MTVPVFHASRELLAGSSTVRLDGPEGRHAALVRRLQPRERIDLTDGAGLVAECVILQSDGYALDLEVQELRMHPAPRPRLTVVQGLAKGERGETAVETMTEIGVDVIVPWSAGRSIAQWKGERGAKSLAKWRSTAREAAKQARRCWWPEVTEPASTARVAKLLAGASVPIVLHEEAELPLAGIELPGGSDEVVLVVGPEGGITPEELMQFAQAGAAPYRMGPTVLRTSTAGTAAAAVLLARSGRWD
ncbi:16S rRNA (uracil(1498)-N(3))-methyltransferase [Actinospica robiniae]|uniref:16S rRNA (uracil(1498)-N(3))-methyltransferase n=1 Tax=Actinospica robiniae TaxID=304901 RepID=UPI0003F7C62D|nr:16S rRNA (uracil(1498)-N(3))-methyltransferase [Actinospica robiniae]